MTNREHRRTRLPVCLLLLVLPGRTDAGNPGAAQERGRDLFPPYNCRPRSDDFHKAGLNKYKKQGDDIKGMGVLE